MTPEEYIKLVTDIHNLILKDIDNSRKEDLEMLYPRLITMYEFFRLLRGEAFSESRPPTPEKQNSFYKMEDEIAKKIDEIKTKIDFNNDKTKFYIAEAQKAFLK
jgi:hypothetical protein